MARTKAKKTRRGAAKRTVRRNELAKLNLHQMSRRTVKLSDENWVQAWIKWYGENRSEYERLGRHLQKVLETAAGRLAPLAIVETRPKTAASYAEKLQRKLRKYRMTDSTGRLVHPITDMCGARVITHTLTQVKAICKFIEDHFEIDRENSVDVATRLRTNEFGYLSVHYVIQFKADVFPTRDVAVRVPGTLFDLYAEIQVRTLLEHAWAAISHDLSYKNTFNIPDKWEREFARLAAILEDTDETFCRLESGLTAYAASYGAYMTKEQMRSEMVKAEVVLGVDPTNVEVAHRIAKLAMCLGKWREVVRVLKPFADADFAPILRDLGVAMCKLYKKGARNFKRGQKYLLRAIELDPGDSDAIASLGGTWRGLDEDKALDQYRQAYHANPNDPYPLGNYLEYEIARRKDLSPVSFAMPSLRAAIQKCRGQADVDMNMPWAFYDMGKFHLLLKEPYESLNMYAKAVSVSVATGVIETSSKSLEKLILRKEQIPGLEWVSRFLALAIFASSKETKLPRSLKAKASKGRRALRGPVVIVAGKCEGSAEPQLQDYAQLLLRAFEDFKGTVISGGTTAGVSGLVGDVGAAYRGRVRTIGYVPSKVPADQIRRRYHEIRRTGGDEFSPAQALQAWTDILASGLSLSEVRLLGLGGGSITAAEYRIALALGVRVGVIADSGGAVAELLADDDWSGSETLFQLPADAMTVRAFIGPEGPGLPEDIRESIARAIHEAYRLDQAHRLQSEDPSMADWDDLLENLKESNRQQGDHILEKLTSLGYTVCKAKKGRKVSRKKFNEREIETMAATEHGRWNTERILDGWRLGEKKDVNKKISPYLVSWRELAEDVKEWDRQTVRGIPEFLGGVGLEIRRRGGRKR